MERPRAPAVLGWLAGALLAASAFLPYWQARLFAPQYPQGLTATMHLHKLTGDIEEIDGLNHYVGVRKLGTVAVWEKRLSLPGLALLVLLCLTAFPPQKRVSSWLKVATVAAFPLMFMADMKYWLHVASTDLDPAAPLKLKPFVIPLVGAGKVGQFRSELSPMPGFYLAVAAALLLLEGLRLQHRRLSLREKHGLAQAAWAASLLCALAVAPADARPLQPVLDEAAPGSVVDLEAGVYEGPAVVAKRLTLKGRGAVVDGGGEGTVLAVTAPGTVVEGLTLRASGSSLLGEDAGLKVTAASVTARGLTLEDVLFGVFASNAGGLVLEDSVLRGKELPLGRRGDLVRVWNCDAVRLSRNRLEGGRDMVLWFSTGSIVESNAIMGGRYGLHFMYTHGARVSGNLFRGNSVGLYVMYSRSLVVAGNTFERQRGPSGTALGLKESDSITVSSNTFRDNRQAVFLDQSPLVETNANTFSGNIFAYNDVAVTLMPGVRGNVFCGNGFVDNLQQAAVRGAGRLSGNDWTGNYWSDYAGYGRGGRGAAPYRAERVLERLADTRPLARYFLYTPAAQAVELAARAFPLFKPQPLFIDTSPLLSPPPGRPEPPRAPRPLLAGVWAPAGLLSASAAAVALLGGWRARAAPRRRARLSPFEPTIFAAGLSKSYGGRPVLADLSFSVMPGECLLLWGSNGAGKSTLMRCLLGVEPCEGRLTVAGFDAAQDGALARAHIGYLAQEFAGYDWSARDSMEFVCAVRGEDPACVSALLAQCGLAGQEEKAVAALSGGMRQKLALAQALIGDPEILLLDEPCSSLDLKSRRELTAVLVKLKGTRSIVMTSHHLEEARALADRVLWLEEGRPARLMRPEAFLAEVAAGERA